MTEPRDDKATENIFCRRLDRPITVNEHCDCLYCFGKAGDVQSGEHLRFCDFDPDKDPVNFGFPGDMTRPAR